MDDGLPREGLLLFGSWRCGGHRPVIVTHSSAPQPVGMLFRSWLPEARVGSGDLVLQKFRVVSLGQSGRFQGMGTDVCLDFMQRLWPAASTRRVQELVLPPSPGLWSQTFKEICVGSPTVIGASVTTHSKE